MTEFDKIKLSSYLKTTLSQGIHELIFEKVDKSIRVLKCTREQEIISETFTKESQGKSKFKSTSSESLKVYDIETNSWKSFKLENIISIDGINKSEIFKFAQITTGI